MEINFVEVLKGFLTIISICFSTSKWWKLCVWSSAMIIKEVFVGHKKGHIPGAIDSSVVSVPEYGLNGCLSGPNSIP